MKRFFVSLAMMSCAIACVAYPISLCRHRIGVIVAIAAVAFIMGVCTRTELCERLWACRWFWIAMIPGVVFTLVKVAMFWRAVYA